MNALKLFSSIAVVLASLATLADTTAPTVSITSPKDLDPVGGKVTVTATATDDVGVAAVEFYKANTLLTTDSAAPFETEYDFNKDAPDADVVIKAVAKDAAGNKKEVEIKVKKPAHDFRPPGANLTAKGAFFKVWAPNAAEVALTGDFNSWSRTDNLLWKKSGWFFGFEPGATDGQKYRFVIDGKSKSDPYGRVMEHSSGASIIKDASKYVWGDAAWSTPRFENMIIYELHIGTFVGKHDGQTYPGSFKKLITKLDYIKSTGANMIEILPVHEVPGPDAPNPTPYIGYSPTGLFAVEESYSAADGESYNDLKEFIDAAHQKGLGVILDVVYNHFSTFN
jgi:1,4-alpha-glucan branching enzyme